MLYYAFQPQDVKSIWVEDKYKERRFVLEKNGLDIYLAINMESPQEHDEWIRYLDYLKDNKLNNQLSIGLLDWKDNSEKENLIALSYIFLNKDSDLYKEIYSSLERLYKELGVTLAKQNQ